MQESSIQFQHFWIDLILGLVMIYVLVDAPLEQALVGIATLAALLFFSQAIQRSRRASLRRAEQRRRREEAEAQRLAAIQAKREALRLAQEEAAKKYL